MLALKIAMASWWQYGAVFLLANVPFCCHGEEKKTPLIPIGSHNIVGKFGQDVDLLCKKPEKKDIEWVLPSGEQSSKNVTTDRLTQIDSKLRIQNVTWNDTGMYMCRLSNDSSHNDTVQFKVYEMPTYFTEGIIIVSINCGLLLLFLVCVGLTFIRNNKKRKTEKYRRSEFTKNLKSYS